MLRIIAISCGLGLLGGLGACSSGSSSNAPPEARALQDGLQAGVEEAFLLFAQIQGFLDAVAAQGELPDGAVFEPDEETAEPNDFNVRVPFDTDNDGIEDGAAFGTIVFDDDPFGGGLLGGSFDLEVNLPDGVQLVGAGNFGVGPDGLTLSGDVDVANATAQTTTSFSVDPATPLLVNVATGEPDSVANVCTLNVAGPIAVEAESPAGLFAAQWNFLATSRSIGVTNAMFTSGGSATAGTEPQPETTDLPDSSFEFGSCEGGSIEDWAGSHFLNWTCDGVETGQSILTITVTGPETIRVTHTDPGGGGTPIVHDATVDPATPHTARGFFTDSDSGGTYREDFVWTLSPDSETMTQTSTYEYQSGPAVGAIGFCTGTTTRQ